MVSQSVCSRNEGNSYYRAASANFSPTVRKDRLEKAVNSYAKALQSAENNDEKASAAKNMAQSFWKLASLFMEETQRINRMCNYYFHSSLEHFGKAHMYGADVKDAKWQDGATQALYSCMQDAVDFSSALNYTDRLRALEDYITLIPVDHFKAECFIEVANVLFHHGIVAIMDGDYKTCLKDMKNCYYPIEEARRFSRGQISIRDDAEVLEEDVFMHLCVAESMQARKIGDELFRQLMQDEESINMTAVYAILDWYKQAILLTREKEVEMEAIALSQLGRVYDKVLKLKYKAKENFMRCMQLAQSLHPRTFYSEDWYKQCVEALERYQQEQVQRDEKAKQAEREPFMKELENELKELELKSLDTVDLLLHVYDKHPPKNPNHRLENKESLRSAEHATLKKTLLKATLHYHPDRQNESEQGKKWVILSEEITKVLTRKYETFK